MPIQVLMPQLGESVEEGTISRWLKSQGDKIEEFEPLLEVNTDKVDTEIPSPSDGVLLEIVVPEGTTVRAGELLAWIGEPGEEAPDGAPRPETVEEAAAPEPAPEPAEEAPGAPRPAVPAAGRDQELGFISPVVARIASQENVDLYQVEGTGQGGRITKKDILAYLERREAEPTAPVSPAEAPAPRAVPAPAPRRESAPAAMPAPAAGEILPLTPVRQRIAEHMVNSKRTSPHVTTIMEADLGRVVAHRQANKGSFARDGVKLTFTPYFIAATVEALKVYPVVNSSWTDEGIQLHKNLNVGMATSLGEEGLIVPVIHNADRLSLVGLAQAVNDLAERARSRQLKPDEVRNGTFSITNHGISGSLFATPIINQPQCGILGVGKIQKRVVVVEGPAGDSIAIRPMVYLSLTFDHRILDGAIADYFLGKVVESLENWS